jgi:tRNA wybutosine-synthesizing protein 2
MFSRGNITEKTRVLSFPDIQGEEVADLFVGIGYFAFSYLKAGAKRVWGWDLNPWSIEGLRRGAVMNGWKCSVNPGDAQDTQLVVYNEDNKAAVERLRELDVRVRHVNLGLLPSSHLAWKIAAEILDEKGGWIHVHGNCKDSEIDTWSGDVAQEFRGLFDSTWQVEIKHQFRVKEFGPGVGHWVLDVVCSRS